MRAAIEILCDFDGTISPIDTVDLLLERLADPAWRLLEERWIRGDIGSRECMSGQIALVRGGWPAIEDVLAGVTLEPTFADFAVWCRQAGIRLDIVSEGLDRVIRHLLAREGIRVDRISASRLVEHPDGRLSLAPAPAAVMAPPDAIESSRDARCGAALCKCALFSSAVPRPLRVLVGDGRSDFCCAARADVVFARSTLAIHCRQNDIAFVPFDDFRTVRKRLEARIARFVASPAVEES
jgi:2,3-diketo-5-methylthio-1-phosphopentane phosphatase